MPKIIDVNTKEKFIEMRAKGMSYERIAEELNVSKPTLMKLSREHEMEISNMRALEMQSLMEQYYVTKEKRVQLLGEELKRLEEEIQKREYDEMSLKELIDLKLKYADKLKSEEVEVILQDSGDAEDSLNDLLKQTNAVKWRA